MNRFSFTIILLGLFLPNVFSQRLNDAIRVFVNDADFKFGGISISVLDVENGKLLAGHNPNLGLIPASSLKVITTATALHFLGDSFRFKTELQYDGEIDMNGTLNGNLFVKGYGDPTLGSAYFDKAEKLDVVMHKFVEAIQAFGIKKVNGRIIGDASFFESEVIGSKWLWEDLGNYYGAGSYGLNIQENLYFIDFKQMREVKEKPPIVAIRPSIPNLLLINEVKSDVKGSGDNAYIFGAPYTYTRYVRGTIPVGENKFTIKGSIPDPPFFAAHYLAGFLEKNGIETSKLTASYFDLERENKISTVKRNIIFIYQSPPLRDIVKRTNMKSVNLYCEAMLRMLGKKMKGKGTPKAGLEVVYDFLKERKMDTEGFFLLDGSGLSPMNSATTYQMASAIRIFLNDDEISNSFKNSMPVSAKSGALKYMLKGTAAAGNVFAKSGGMERVRSYTGFIKTKKGRVVSFSMIANNFTCKSSQVREKMEKLMLAIYEN
ncbi:MAG: D-alanyl-D-alanine carboxypeptidase/D-alanyl-D-alanine-endopeptidase [Saprospiraceae bacterium]|nr:D-alanyl-D-alanine carboxypeptidase/D-alanyl-D-alanine-endopeptidase [Saprospiraceae bacterium]